MSVCGATQVLSEWEPIYNIFPLWKPWPGSLVKAIDGIQITCGVAAPKNCFSDNLSAIFLPGVSPVNSSSYLVGGFTILPLLVCTPSCCGGDCWNLSFSPQKFSGNFNLSSKTRATFLPDGRLRYNDGG